MLVSGRVIQFIFQQPASASDLCHFRGTLLNAGSHRWMQASTGPLGAALSAPVGCLERLEALGWEAGKVITMWWFERMMV